MKNLILGKISDLVSDFLYYNRKNDEELSVEDLENAIKNKEITIDEIVDEFRKKLTERIHE